MMNEIEICTLNGTKWILGDESPEMMTWEDAKAWCESIGQELPSREVLLMAYLNPETHHLFANNGYWSSSEYSITLAWYQYFGDGNQNLFNKISTLPFRAVRAIEMQTEKIIARDEKDKISSALNVQVGGSHYKDQKIQPVEYIEANDIKFLEGCVIKRVTRHDKPTGKGKQDIEKTIHELQLLLELRYPEIISSYETIKEDLNEN